MEPNQKRNSQPIEHEAQEKSLQRSDAQPEIKKGPRNILTEFPSHQGNLSQPNVPEDKYESAQLFEAPQCLLYTNSLGKLDFDADVLKQVAELEKMLVVVAVTGNYRTGKSYLLNRLAGKNSGFSLGNTVLSHTKGIWIWVREHPIHSDRYLVLLDTEGLGDARKGDKQHGSWLFCLATLLSSVLVYNTMVQIDEYTLEQLSFITDISKHISTSLDSTDHQADENFDCFFPDIIFVVRDFMSGLETAGREATEDEYLADCLLLKPDDDERSARCNMTRKCIRRYFRNRKCFTIDLPTVDQTLLRQLDQIQESDLGQEFLRDTKAFREHVNINGPVKKLGTERPLNGRMWAVLVRNYIEAIQIGAMPCIEKAIGEIANIENKLAKEEALRFYTSRMETTDLPTPDEKTLSEIHFQAHSAAMRRFLEKYTFDEENGGLKQLNELIHHEYERMIAKNNEASRVKCRQLLELLGKEMHEKIRRDQYFKLGGLKEYDEDRQKIQTTYEGTAGLGPQAKVILLEYILEKTEEEKKITEECNAITVQQN